MNPTLSKTLRVLVPLCLMVGSAACALDGADVAASASAEQTPSGEVTGESDEAFTVALGGVHSLIGHEDITRLAIDAANTALGGAPFYPVVDLQAAPQWRNAVVRGNFETDDPSQFMRNFHSEVGDWHKDPRAQNMHALRNYPNNRVESARRTCLGTQNMIAIAADAAKAKYATDPWRAFYFVGHGSHTLQDSFSPAHTVRSGAGSRTINNFCTYGRLFPGVCRHADIDLRDQPWKGGDLACFPNTSIRTLACLDPEAQGAVAATKDYLVAMKKAMTTATTVDSALAPVFAKYLKCDNL